MSRRVVIAYKSLPAYRRQFFDSLRLSLDRSSVSLDLVHGQATGSDRAKRDDAELPWATLRPNRVLQAGTRSVLWQPIWDIVKDADLVIVEQASRLLINYCLLGNACLGKRPKVALWGHGANLQKHSASRVSEWMKARYSVLPHWWFAYTEGTRKRVEMLGYPPERITVVQNAIDTTSLRREVAAVENGALHDFYGSNGATPGNTAIFMGSLYAEKRLDFLFEVAQHIWQLDNSFVLLVGGDGPGRGRVLAAERSIPAVRYLGRLDGPKKALALRAAEVALMPGLVGLNILDSFAAELPVVTTSVDFHSPEIEYLSHGYNGVCLPATITAADYAGAVMALLADSGRTHALKLGCRESARRFTNEAMVERFQCGVLEALK